ncbi:MAG: histidine kinase dimerization/phospho-acceptor domain-containing protein, partial [Alphaproteobacteria bacterium]|nr:histidine kinase dimerization/phospho-acceptor domain-containing protein [Alphaproteobacteria bacterium]
SIRQLLLLAFLLAGLLPAMLVSFLSFYQTRTVLKQEITRDMQTLSTAVANDIERMMFERFRNVQSWSQLSIMQELKIGDIDKRLSIFLDGLAHSYGSIYHAIYVEDLQGNIIASSQAQAIGQHHINKPPWFTANISGQLLTIAKIEQDSLAISEEIIDENTNLPMGRLVVEFNWLTVQDALNNAIKKSTAAALLDAQGNVLAATTNWQVIESGHGMHAASQISLQTAIPIWQVRVEKLHSDAVAPVHKLGYIFLGLLAATLLLAIVLVRPIAQAITHPLMQLTQFVRGFAHQSKEKPPQSGPPEVRELGAAFEAMMADLAKTQENLTRAAKLAVVGEMAAAMSHEVRTPLGILRSSADVLNREKSLSPEGKEVLSFIISETERLNKLVSTLIDAARPRLPTFTEINIAQLIINTIALLRSHAQAKQIEVTFIDQAQALIAEMDADQMTQVIMNLVMNAIQVLPEGGKIVVELK